jgi:GT2 family glycosyltransferase
MPLQLSVIIPSYKRNEPLELCLEDLAVQQGVNRSDFEVICVLQSYPDGSAEKIEQRFSDRLQLQVAEFPSGLGTSRARNTGLAMAKGEIVAFLDDDVRLPPNWVADLIRFYDDRTLSGVGGFVDHPGHYNVARNTMYRLLGFTSNRYKIDWGGFNVGPANHPREDQRAEWLSGGNMSFRRNVIQAVGGFDEALGSFWHEDVDVAHRVARTGLKVMSSRKLAVEHYPSTINRPPLHAQMRERERSRVLFVWKAIGSEPFWRARYATRLVLHALAMSVVGLVKADPRIPFNVLRGGWEGYRGLPAARAASTRHIETAR